MTLPPGSPSEAARTADERSLIARARAGDQAAFGALADRHAGRAYALALRMLRSPSDAEEVAQDALVRAWHALPGFRGDAAFATWLHRIVVRRALDRAEVLRNRRARERLDDAPPERAAPEHDADALQAGALQRLIERLTPPQRAAVTLYYFEGRSVEQVAATLAMPENTVKTHLSRARAALREGWTREHGDDA